MNCHVCGFPYATSDQGELVCYHCLLATLEKKIAHIRTIIEGYDFPKTHSELTRGTFEGVANLGQEIALLKHDVCKIKQKILILEKNLRRLFK